MTRAIPAGGLERFDWAAHEAAHRRDVGRWQLHGRELVIQWADGGTHQGPLMELPNGIEFYGKRYASPVPVVLTAIVGRWETARGMAIANGSGTNTASTLVIQGDGRYQWLSTTGGLVEGRAVSSSAAMAGIINLTGATILLTSDEGTATSHTFLPVAGTPIAAFALDSNMFTRAQ